MASLTAQVTVLLSQVFATCSMQTHGFDNPASGDLYKVEVLCSMFIYVPFSHIRQKTTETKQRQSRDKAACKCTLHILSFLTVYRDLIKMCL